MFPFRSLAPVCLTVLSGCVQHPDIVTGFSVHTQRGFVVAKPQLLSEDADSYVLASPATETSGSQTRWTIQTSVVRKGPNFPIIQEAWSFGQRLSYHKRDRRRAPCRTSCLREEVGEIALSETDFRTAARDGFAFQLIGRRGSYSGHIPADAFRLLLDRLDDRSAP